VQVDPIKPTLKAPRTKRLKLTYVEALSIFASKFSLRRYTSHGAGGVDVGGGGGEAGAGPASADVKVLKEELKDRKRQMHKLQEVYGRLKEKFTAAGGAPTAFDTCRTAGAYTRPLLSSS